MFVVETILRLVMASQTYVQAGIDPLPRTSAASKTFRPKNVVGVGVSLFQLPWEIRDQASVGEPAVQRGARSSQRVDGRFLSRIFT